MIEFMIVWALIGHAYWLWYMLDDNMPCESLWTDVIAMFGLWLLGPLPWAADFIIRLAPNGQGGYTKVFNGKLMDIKQ